MILVGEIRDLETAGVAVQASVTGHLVLATLHTNDAIGVISRLSALGLHQSAVASSFRGALAQRLVRKVCSQCSEKVDSLTPAEERLVNRYGVRPAVRARGCDHCGKTGYRGRLPVIEIVVKTAEIEDLIGNGASALELGNAAKEAGAKPMISMALDKARRA